MTRKNILIVDDDKIQLVNADVILRNDFTLVAAESGIQALDYLSQGLAPDLILLDLLMPEMDGFETYSRIREIKPMKDIPIIFLTSVSDEDKIEQALAMGAADYIVKPYSKKNLLSRIQNTIINYEYMKSKKASHKAESQNEGGCRDFPPPGCGPLPE